MLAIQHLVAAAVPGLAPERIALVDDRGTLLARGGDLDSESFAAGETEEFRAAYEARLRQTIEDLLARSLGPDRVRAQVNAEIPYTLGAGELPVDHFDALVEGDEEIVDARARSATDQVSDRIAALAAALVPDGGTIQFGIGSIPDAILGGLGDRKGLRVHSGLVSEACVDLYEAGVVDAPMVAAEVVSSPRMRWPSDSFDISSEKIAMPCPSGAALHARFKQNAVLPIDGRAATMISSDG